MEAYKFTKNIEAAMINIELSIPEAKGMLEFLESTVAYGTKDREMKEQLLKMLESGLEVEQPEPSFEAVSVDEDGVPF